MADRTETRPRTIGNPLTWLAQATGRGSGHLARSAQAVGSADSAPPRVRVLTMQDLRASLAAGWRDFTTCRSDVMFLVLIYPVIGLALMGFGLQRDLIPMLFPLIAGFALLGPVAAVGLYEISRRLETGESAGWAEAFSVIGRPAFGGILVLGLYLVALFLVWMLAAALIHEATLGAPPASFSAFATEVTGSAAGWTMIVAGCLTGFLLALVALAVSVVSFPLLLDRPVGVPVAVMTSIRVFRESPAVVMAWGALIAGGLVLGSIPLLAGLVIVLPVFGHASWHLYRRAVV